MNLNGKGNSILVLALSMALAEGSMAQSVPKASTPAEAAAPVDPEAGFAERKKYALDRIANNIAKLHALQSCVQAATNSEQLSACRLVRVAQPAPAR